jgi:hypothetical protein
MVGVGEGEGLGFAAGFVLLRIIVKIFLVSRFGLSKVRG